MISGESKLNSGVVVGRNGEGERTTHMFLLGWVHDAFHVGEDDVSVAVLQSLHEFQVVADLETLDRLLL